MKEFRCAALLTAAGWREPAWIAVDDAGCIAKISDKATGPGPIDLGGYVIPGFQNAHSHAFQFAMAGLAEHLPAEAKADDFWTWRDAMYRLAGKVTPESMERVGAAVYAEMARHGYTAVAEFHYLHHGPAGKPYGDLAEMGARLIAAAGTAGIRLTLVPVCYRQGGFGQPPTAAQGRFVSKSVDDYFKLLEATRTAAKSGEDVTVGRGVHSLRAVSPEDAKRVLSAPGPGPVHLHVAEQRREVDECVAHLGARPVAWLLDNVPLSPGHALVHATHVDEKERSRLTACGATVVLCPSTEGNLGDGFFPLKEFVGKGGCFAIGTDSHIGLSPMEELRWLDYGQRLRTEKRNVLCTESGQDSGRIAFDHAWTRGRLALGLPAREFFSVGEPFDAVVLDPEHPSLVHRPAERRLAALIYGADVTALRGTLRRGAWVVDRGRHVRGAAIRDGYAKALAALKS